MKPATPELFAKVLLVLVWPAVLLLAAGLGLGCYYETNDDLAISQLLCGVGAAGPVADLHLYFHGYAAAWVWLYRTAPTVPWYGLTLYGLLYAATALAFAVLRRLLRPYLAPPMLAAALAVFFGLGWVEHGLWFNYMRVPLLLSGSGLLYAAQRLAGPRHKALEALLVGGAAFGLSWLIRPSAAGLAALAAAPGVYWLLRAGAGLGPDAAPAPGRRAGWQALGLLGGAGLLGALLTLGLGGGGPGAPAAAAYRRLDVLKSLYLDYELTRPAPRTPSDALALRTVQHWQFGDSSLVNEAFFQRALPFEGGYFVRHVAPAKLVRLGQLLARDYFPLLLWQLVLGLTVLRAAGWAGRGGFWLGQAGWLGLLLALGVGQKLPPRLGLPLFDLWLLGSAAYVLPHLAATPRLRRFCGRGLALVALLAAGPYAYKTGHRHLILRAEAHRNALALAELRAQALGAQVLVTDALTPLYKSASPFRNYEVLPPAKAPRYVLSLNGWWTPDPSQPVLRQHLTGTRASAAALHRLARWPAGRVCWYLTPGGAALLR